MPKLLEVRDLKTYFFTRRGVVRAVDGVSFSLDRGDTLGIVGESGCGKTVTCLSIMRLVPQPAGKVVGGEILLDGDDLLKKSEREMRGIRGSRIAIIVQDPMTSLNPVFSIGNQLTETIVAHRGLKGAGLKEAAVSALQMVRIPSPEVRLRNFPHQLSGGTRQRVVGAIALSCEPELLIADEPTTSLDVTTQSYYLDLLKELRDKTGMALIFITHNLGIVADMCHRVAVMYAGRIVEMSNARELFKRPIHPYTVALMKSVPTVDRPTDRLYGIPGQPPNLNAMPAGCSFHPRCASKNARCEQDAPPVRLQGGRMFACWNPQGGEA